MSNETTAIRPASITSLRQTARRETQRLTGRLWLKFLCILLVGYALFGRGFAYVGIPPAFVGELALMAGLAWLFFKGKWRAGGDSMTMWLLGAFAAWCACRTIPYLMSYRTYAMRDAVLWGYAGYAVVIFSVLITQPLHLEWLIERYRRFVVVFLISMPIIWLVKQEFNEFIPRWPWANVSMIVTKGGDLLVHVGGVFAFVVAGLITLRARIWYGLIVVLVLMVGVFNRGGMLSFATAFMVCLLFRPHHVMVWRTVVFGIVAIVILGVTAVQLDSGDRGRPLSFDQLSATVLSLGSSTNVGDLDGTKQWRLNWWEDIYDYTVNGEYFWGGKGFGVNLADDDGYQIFESGRLRSPHNGHMTILARAGVPGLLLWVLLQLSWAWEILNAYIDSNRHGDRRWAGLFLFLFAYWLAHLVNASVDVFLEGPMGGIWFWTIFGTGLAARWIYQRHPEILADREPIPVN